MTTAPEAAVARSPSPKAPGRPIGVTVVAIMALVYGIVLTISGVLTLLDAHGDNRQLFGAANDLFFAAVALLVAVGAFLGKRWAWVLFMSWAVWGLTFNLLRYFFLGGPRYVPLVVGTLAVFLLTPPDIQVAFRVRKPPNIRLDAPTRNPIDSI
jgi:hypothetical protein